MKHITVRLIAAFVILLFNNSQALANWHFVKWGMSPADVERAAKQAGVALTPLGPKPDGSYFDRYKTPYKAAGLDFDAVFGFSSDNTKLPNSKQKLTNVSLEMKVSDLTRCKHLRSALIDTYGKPIGQVGEDNPFANGLFTATWRDVEEKNIVTWIWLGQSQSCQVIYTDLKKGL